MPDFSARTFLSSLSLSTLCSWKQFSVGAFDCFLIWVFLVSQVDLLWLEVYEVISDLRDHLNEVFNLTRFFSLFFSLSLLSDSWTTCNSKVLVTQFIWKIHLRTLFYSIKKCVCAVDACVSTLSLIWLIVKSHKSLHFWLLSQFFHYFSFFHRFFFATLWEPIKLSSWRLAKVKQNHKRKEQLKLETCAQTKMKKKREQWN